MTQLIPGVERLEAPADQSHELIARLVHLHANKVKLNGDSRPTVGCTELKVPDHPESASLKSWKFNEHSYGKPDRPLPTNARGLFSFTAHDRHRIVLRGYDKFFNTDEVAVTKWTNIETQTSGPYDLTLKQNGCIIFIGALPDNTLLVSSKHSIGIRDEGESHAERGRKWLTKHLTDSRRTEAELANVLQGLTAVCELCDDDFEEHILAYPPEKSGLYLHGLNLNVVQFSTYSVQDVHRFAQYFGFRSNPAISVPDLLTLRTLLDTCAKTGTYDGTEVEGFVVRTQIDSCDFFFKYKFEQPYLLFRQWREVTKALIAGKEPRYRTHKEITRAYIRYILPIIRDPAVAKDYQQNHGIISLREKFLLHHGGDLSAIIANPQDTDEDTDAIDWQQDRFVLVPIATVGCGKTTIALALQHLFGFGHVQNDNIIQKKAAFLFAKNIYDSFQHSRIVIADRNNHMRHERESLARDLKTLSKTLDPPTHLIALEFVQTSALRDITVDRVLRRGDNHQSIRAATMSEAEIVSIMDGFHKRFQQLNLAQAPDDCFCDVIQLDPIAGSRHNLTLVTEFLFKHKMTRAVTNTELDAAIVYAMSYKPTIYKEVKSHPSERKVGEQSKKKEKIKTIDFYGIEVTDLDLSTIDSEFLQQLYADDRVHAAFHITLAHSSAKSHPGWQYCSDHIGDSVRFRTACAVHNERVMAIEVILLDEGIPHINTYPHITIGTANSSIKPVESNTMLINFHTSGTGVQTPFNFESTGIITEFHK